ncbi:calpain-5-like [Dreissena polymorpha]|nr:calpain-5-like [Dreissena polymorpha]XP_052217042.1 calpain-5-like [Dreissena polymorpha]XP_052217043.1 calpain-5-like [Dreissena polymorpha]
MGLFDSTVPFKGQVYKDLKNKAIKSGALFTDPEFPPRGSSIYFSKPAPTDIIWKRPGELVSNPKFFEAGVSADDFSQGSLGNCWFVAACACLAEDSKLWKKIMPDHEEQEWSESNKYAGIFHFKFWRCGTWVDVVIDDYLPTRGGRLIYVHSNTRNEFWSALLEKAYAKLAGDYESLVAGNSKDALVDMTGGVGERLDLADFKTQEQRKDLFRILRHSKENHSLMSASIMATGREMEAKLSCGLVKGHAYSVTAVKKIKLGTGLFSIFARDHLQMVRCRNPWGGTEWKGAWSDGSPEWKKVSESQKKELGLTFDDNGEFWMSYEDFCHYFTSMDICHMFNTSFFSIQKTWREGKVKGQWRTPDRCGGCGNHSTFLNNPQYLFDIVQDEEEMMISLEQKDKRVEKSSDNFTIGFTILKADINRKYRVHDRLDRICSGPFVLSRSVFNRVKLSRGRYCIIPSTFDPRQCGEFVLRMYASNTMNLIELLHDEPLPGKFCCITMQRRQVAATQVTIVKAEGLEPPDNGNTADPYCIIKCEGRTIETHYKEKTLTPEWNDRVTLYRKKPYEEITIEVWDHNVIKDQLMGVVTLPMDKPQQYTGGNVIKGYGLSVKGKDGPVNKPGRLWLKVFHTDNMASV